MINGQITTMSHNHKCPLEAYRMTDARWYTRSRATEIAASVTSSSFHVQISTPSVPSSVRPRSLALSPTRFPPRVTSRSDCLIGCYSSLACSVVLRMLVRGCCYVCMYGPGNLLAYNIFIIGPH